jgi:hypothetical protein
MLTRLSAVERTDAICRLELLVRAASKQMNAKEERVS